MNHAIAVPASEPGNDLPARLEDLDTLLTEILEAWTSQKHATRAKALVDAAIMLHQINFELAEAIIEALRDLWDSSKRYAVQTHKGKSITYAIGQAIILAEEIYYDQPIPFVPAMPPTLIPNTTEALQIELTALETDWWDCWAIQGESDESLKLFGMAADVRAELNRRYGKNGEC